MGREVRGVLTLITALTVLKLRITYVYNLELRIIDF